MLCQTLVNFLGTPWDNMEGDRTYGTRATSPRARAQAPFRATTQWAHQWYSYYA